MKGGVTMSDTTIAKKWFKDEHEANEYAKTKKDGKVYSDEFLGGYTVQYEVEKEARIKENNAMTL